MLVKRVVLRFEPLGRRVKARVGRTVFEVARDSGVFVRSECGGKGLCGKCRVIIRGGGSVSPVSRLEREHLTRGELKAGYRLACQTEVLGDATVFVPEESRIEVRKIQVWGFERRVTLEPAVKKFYVVLPKPCLSDVQADWERLVDQLRKKFGLKTLTTDVEVLERLPRVVRRGEWAVTATVWNAEKIVDVEAGDVSSESYGLAVDVGTSKIVVYLVDLNSGDTVAVGAIENPQIMYGEDVISRITFAFQDSRKLKSLQRILVRGINAALEEACKKAAVSRRNVYEAVFVGNTAMHHFFFGIDATYLAVSPYTPAVSEALNVKAEKIGLKINPNANIHALPVLGGFVGPDAVADILSSRIHRARKKQLLLDIGTNTEVVLGDREGLVCCSCASGPAFEGVHIKHGVKAVSGAIEKVRINPSSLKVEYETIGGEKPLGICGTGIIDAVAEMFKARIIDEYGRFNKNVKAPCIKEENGEKQLVIAGKDETATGKEIVVTQADINEIQLAKAAVYTGCAILMKKENVHPEDLDQVFIAGAFGSHINSENAVFLGLVPDVPLRKIKFLGNTAVTGAKAALISTKIRREAEEIVKKTRYVELGAQPEFQSEFSKALSIPHRDLARFPTVKKWMEDFKQC